MNIQTRANIYIEGDKKHPDHLDVIADSAVRLLVDMAWMVSRFNDEDESLEAITSDCLASNWLVFASEDEKVELRKIAWTLTSPFTIIDVVDLNQSVDEQVVSSLVRKRQATNNLLKHYLKGRDDESQ